MPKLVCVVVGQQKDPFVVDIAADQQAHYLKENIKGQIGYAGDVCDMHLYRALMEDGAWLGSKSQHARQLEMGDIPDQVKKLLAQENKLDSASTLDEELKNNPSIGPSQIHVLVVVPRADTMIRDSCPHISVINLLQQNPLPEGMEFTQAMQEPLGFRIPLMGQEEVSLKPDAFIHGQAEYRSVIDTFLYHSTISGSELDVVSIDFNWLALFPVLCNCVLYRDEVHESSSCPGLRPDAVLVKRGILVGKCESKASSKKMDIAAKELTEKMALAAYCTFPRGLTSIPAWTTCPTRFQLHRLSYVFTTKTYQEEVLTSYNVTATLDRMRFVVDLFKILKWVCSLDKPNVLMHLFPQVRTKTPNGHYITWLKSGLVKEFREGSEVNMELIQSIYNNTKFLHVERGRCNCTSVTITSIGQTLENSLQYFQGQPKLIFDQVKNALDELHSIGIAHCDVRAANVFVLLEDRRVILGDLEYCRALHDPPPDVKVFPKKKDACKTALELDMYQLGVFQDELGRLMS